MLYFDTLGARKPRQSVIQKYEQACLELWAHPASVHQMGQQVLRALHSAYLELSCYLQADNKDTLLFCNSPEEAIAHIIQGVWNELSRPSGRTHFLTSNLDEAAIILNLEKISSLGASHDLVDASPSGTIDLQALRDCIHPRTQLLAISWANALTGVIQPVHEIATICKERGILFMLEASNLTGLYPLELSTLQPDFVTLSGNSLGGLMGSALLWMKSGHHLNPLLPCGHDWMHSTASHPGALLALGMAAEQTLQERERDLWHLTNLKMQFENKVRELCHPATVLFESSERLVHVSAIAFKGVHGELLNWHLNRKELYTSFGGGMRQQMHYLLKACRIDPSMHYSALSFGLHSGMTSEMINQAATILGNSVQELRRYHHFDI